MKKSKKRNLLVVVVSSIIAIFAALGITAHAAEITDISGLNGSNATVTNSQGQVVNPADLPADGWTGYNISYAWSIPDSVNISDGDTATVTLPDGMIVNQDTTGVVKNKDDNGEVVGTVKFNEGSSIGTITFNDKLHNQYGKHGILSVTAVKKMQNSGANSGPVGGGLPTWGINKAGWIDQGTEKNGVPTKLYWDIIINPQGKSLSNVKVTDTLGDGQTLDNKTVKFYAINYEAGQENYRKGELMANTSINDNTITFDLGNIDSPVEIEYETDITNINANGGNLWSNQASITTSTADTGWTRTESSATVNWGTGGTAQGYAGKIEITKVDSLDKTKVLPGAVFALENSSGQIVQSQLVTGADGKIEVNNLPDGTYKLNEIKAPAGYQLSSLPITVVLDQANNHTANPVVENKPLAVSSSKQSSSSSSKSSSLKSSSSSKKAAVSSSKASSKVASSSEVSSSSKKAVVSSSKASSKVASSSEVSSSSKKAAVSSSKASSKVASSSEVSSSSKKAAVSSSKASSKVASSSEATSSKKAVVSSSKASSSSVASSAKKAIVAGEHHNSNSEAGKGSGHGEGHGIPQTGEAGTLAIIALGVGLIVIAGIVAFKKKRN